MSNITAALVKKKLHMIPNTIPNWRQRLVTLMKVSILQVTRPNSQLKFDESNANLTILHVNYVPMSKS